MKRSAGLVQEFQEYINSHSYGYFFKVLGGIGWKEKIIMHWMLQNLSVLF